MRLYVTRHLYRGVDYYITGDYTRVEYYQYKIIDWEDFTARQRNDFRSFGFAVPSQVRYGDTGRLDVIWANDRDYPLHGPDKTVPGHERLSYQ